VREISGSVAFERLELDDLAAAALINDENSLNDTNGNGAHPAAQIDTALGRFMECLYPLTRDFDADLRLSAKEIKIGSLLLKDAGFSLFEKSGEVILDLAMTRLFEGTSSGHIKIDTNFPKPRWHTNLSLSNVRVDKMEAVSGLPNWLSGAANFKIHLTSYGDKFTEIYQNVYGAVLFEMPSGGQIAVNLENLNSERADKPGTEWERLFKGNSTFNELKSTGHFAKGEMVTDFFSLKTGEAYYTGLGQVNLSGEGFDWHIASWPLIKDNSAVNEEVGDAPSLPLIKVCSRISGSHLKPVFEKYNAMHLALLRRGCKATYKPRSEKSKIYNNHPLDKAG
jgi:hypothetical protein